MILQELKEEVYLLTDKTIFYPSVDWLTKKQWLSIYKTFLFDYNCYYNGEFEVKKIKYFKGLLATLFYRISRELYLNNEEHKALEFSSTGSYLTGIELYYSAKIGKSFKINHGMATVVGSRTSVGDNVILHQNVTIGEKNQGRASIGNGVIIYPGAVLVGDILIGNNSLVGANTFVDKSYSENSIIF